MLLTISPAKTLDFTTPPVTRHASEPVFMAQTRKLVAELRKRKASELEAIMNISPKLALLNYERFQTWKPALELSKQAVLAFNGDVYAGLDAPTLHEEELLLAQKQLRILSGMYGVLRPLDLIQPHRLEMGTRLEIAGKQDLYDFWREKVVAEINRAVKESGSPVLINLASAEYFKSINLSKLQAEVVTAEFKELKEGKYRMVSFFAKRARGLMTRFVLQNRLSDPEELKAFDSEGYHFNPHLSQNNTLVFTRER